MRRRAKRRPSTSARLKAARALHHAGKSAAAEDAYRAILAADPTCADALRGLTLLALPQGDFDSALSHMLAAVKAGPCNGDHWHLLGRIRLDIGDLDHAAADLTRALKRRPTDSIGAHLDLALCHARRGAWAKSLAIAKMLLKRAPANPFALRAAATAAQTLDRTDLAEQYYKRAVAAHPDDAGGWEGLARIARKRGQTHAALSHLDKATRLDPGDAELAYMRRVVAAEMTPAWHFNMMNDTARNTAFAAAIRRQVKRGHLVFEVGTGAGLLAMLAARAGAKVVTCEANPAIAVTAREIIKRNGLTDRIAVVNKPSWEVKIGVDLPRPADVLIAEIFSGQLLSEDVLPSLEDAKRRLCTPETIVIPAVGVMRGALVQSGTLEALTRVGKVEGFDLSAFNAYTPPLMNLDAPNYALDWLSDPVDLYGFSFQEDDRWPEGTNLVEVTVTKTGRCQGVVQWLWLAVDGETEYENPPLGEKSTRTPHWTPLMYTFPEPLPLTKGQVLRLKVGHDRKGARIEVASDAAG